MSLLCVYSYVLFVKGQWISVKSWVDSMHRQEIDLFSKASRPVFGPTQPPIQWLKTLRLKRQGVNLITHPIQHRGAERVEVCFLSPTGLHGDTGTGLSLPVQIAWCNRTCLCVQSSVYLKLSPYNHLLYVDKTYYCVYGLKFIKHIFRLVIHNSLYKVITRYKDCKQLLQSLQLTRNFLTYFNTFN